MAPFTGAIFLSEACQPPDISYHYADILCRFRGKPSDLSALGSLFDDLPTHLIILDYIKCVFRKWWLKALH